MSEQPSVTTREAVLASLLAHSLFIIYVLLFPNTFRWSGRSPFRPADPNAPIAVEFLEPVQTPPSASLGDAGKAKSSEPRPPDAPKATNDEPYSAGNTRNRFVAPPMPEHLPPAPSAGAPVPPSGDQARAGDPAALQPADPGGDAARGEPSDAGATGRPFYVPPRGERGGSGQSKGGRGGGLREALGRMSMGMSGGAPLKFDNPSGGLTGPQGGLSFDTPGFDWGPYARKIYWVIWTNWTHGWPPAAWAGLKGIVSVHFRIWRDGRITDITIVDPSGTPAFDTCATLALEASSPLPPLPADFPDESEGISARFLYNIDDNGP